MEVLTLVGKGKEYQGNHKGLHFRTTQTCPVENVDKFTKSMLE